MDLFVNLTTRSELARKLEILIGDPKLRQKFRVNSRSHYEAGFTEAIMVERLKNVFNDVLLNKKELDISEENATTYFDRESLKFSKTYNRKIQFQERVQIFRQQVLKHIPPNSRILDLGCGPGTISFMMLNEKYNLVGIDGSEQMIKICNDLLKKLPFQDNAEFFKGIIPGILELFPANSFDGCICSSVLEYIANPEKTVSEVYRIIRDGGYFLLSLPNKDSIFRHFEVLSFKCFSFPTYYKYLLHKFNRDQLNAFISEAGFEVVSNDFFGQKKYLKLFRSLVPRHLGNNMILGVYRKP